MKRIIFGFFVLSLLSSCSKSEVSETFVFGKDEKKIEEKLMEIDVEKSTLSYSSLLENHVMKDIETSLSIFLKNSEGKALFVERGGSIDITSISTDRLGADLNIASNGSSYKAPPLAVDHIDMSKLYKFNIKSNKNIIKTRKITIGFSVKLKRNSKPVVFKKEIVIKGGVSLSSDKDSGEKFTSSAATKIEFYFFDALTKGNAVEFKNVTLSKVVSFANPSETNKEIHVIVSNASEVSNTTDPTAMLPEGGVSVSVNAFNGVLNFKVKGQDSTGNTYPTKEVKFEFTIEKEGFPSFILSHGIKGVR